MNPIALMPDEDRGARVIVHARRLYTQGIPPVARETHLAAVLHGTLSTPGSLTRLQLGLIAGTALGLPAGTTDAFATALEYFHTASLLLDDLPSMDDAQLRRGRPCAHVLHGEGSTVLGALAFINRGYRLVWDALAGSPGPVREAAAAHVERCLGASGVLDGQSLDLHFNETDRSNRTVARIALGKTVSLLRLSLVTPALLAAAGARERLLIDRVSVAWGLAYQIADDFSDLGSAVPAGKTPGRDRRCGRPNLVIAGGCALAQARLRRLLGLLVRAHHDLVLLRPGWCALGPLIDRFVAASSAHLHELAATRCA